MLRVRDTAGTCFALKSILSRRRHRFQNIFAFTRRHRKRFKNGNVWMWINLKTDKYLSVFKFIRIHVGGTLVKNITRSIFVITFFWNVFTQAHATFCTEWKSALRPAQNRITTRTVLIYALHGRTNAPPKPFSFGYYYKLHAQSCILWLGTNNFRCIVQTWQSFLFHLRLLGIC